MRQIAALPYTTAADGSMQILLITSRDTGRWVIPKGNRMKGLAGHRAAELEAYEEAGIQGIACPARIGRYRYDKRRRKGGSREAMVDVFPLAVPRHLTHWPEQGQRELRWFPLAEAAKAVDVANVGSAARHHIIRQPRANAGRDAETVAKCCVCRVELFAFVGRDHVQDSCGLQTLETGAKVRAGYTGAKRRGLRLRLWLPVGQGAALLLVAIRQRPFIMLHRRSL